MWCPLPGNPRVGWTISLLLRPEIPCPVADPWTSRDRPVTPAVSRANRDGSGDGGLPGPTLLRTHSLAAASQKALVSWVRSLGSVPGTVLDPLPAGRLGRSAAG